MDERYVLQEQLLDFPPKLTLTGRALIAISTPEGDRNPYTNILPETLPSFRAFKEAIHDVDPSVRYTIKPEEALAVANAALAFFADPDNTWTESVRHLALSFAPHMEWMLIEAPDKDKEALVRVIVAMGEVLAKEGLIKL